MTGDRSTDWEMIARDWQREAERYKQELDRLRAELSVKDERNSRLQSEVDAHKALVRAWRGKYSNLRAERALIKDDEHGTKI